MAADVDMDGDEDILRRNNTGSSWFWNRSRGDGTFATKASLGALQLGIGLGAGDWDSDGDIDIVTGGLFWRNLVIETTLAGNPCALMSTCFVRAGCVDSVLCGSLVHALVAFADVDRDGDLDVARSAWQQSAGEPGFGLYRNQLYRDPVDPNSASACEPLKRYVNVRPVRGIEPSDRNQRDYSECEFGARVELVLRNDPNPEAAHLRRAQFTSSAAGYLTQNEYLLHFGLPADPDPEDPGEDLRFDLYIDFPSRANEPNEGPLRVDWTVNPALASINLADLYVDPNDEETWGRPITVYRDGRVRLKTSMGMATIPPDDADAVRMHTLGGPLALPRSPDVSLAAPTAGAFLTGLRFTKDPDTAPVRIREIIVDGQLDQDTYGCDYNIVVLDVTDPNDLVPIGRLKAYTFSGNRRTFIPVPPESDPSNPDAFVLPNDLTEARTYEVRVRVTAYRLNPLTQPSGLASVLGIGIVNALELLNSTDEDICAAEIALAGEPDPGQYKRSTVTLRLSRKTD